MLSYNYCNTASCRKEITVYKTERELAAIIDSLFSQPTRSCHPATTSKVDEEGNYTVTVELAGVDPVTVKLQADDVDNEVRLSYTCKNGKASTYRVFIPGRGSVKTVKSVLRNGLLTLSGTADAAQFRTLEVEL